MKAINNQSQIVDLSTTEADLMTLATYSCDIVWARELAPEFGFLRLKSTDVYEDNTDCIALAKKIHHLPHTGSTINAKRCYATI